MGYLWDYERQIKENAIMTSSPNHHKNDYFLSFSDLIDIAKRNRFKILVSGLIIAFLCFLNAATKPIQYTAEGTFKEQNKTQAGFSKSFTSMFGGLNNGDDGGLTIFKSRRLFQELIKKNGMQVSISTKQTDFPFHSLQNVLNNLKIEYALSNNLQYPLFPDVKSTIEASHVIYNGEIPLTFHLVVDSPNTFILFANDKKEFGKGVFNQPFTANNFTITLNKSPKESPQDPSKGKEYFVTLMPMNFCEKQLKNQLEIASDSSDSSLIKLTCTHPNRQQAANIIINLMDVYKDYIIKKNEHINNQQMDYLAERQAEIGSQLNQDLQEHAKTLSTALATTGFASSTKAIDFLGSRQQKIKTQLNANDIALQRLQNIKHENIVDYEKLMLIPECTPIHQFIQEMQKLKQYADALNLALKNNATNSITFQDSFKTQLSELEKIQKAIQEAKQMQKSLENNEIPFPPKQLLDHPQFIVKTWYEHLIANNDVTSPQWQKNKQGFITYLTYLINYLSAYQRNLEARFSNQQNALKDFEGINLATVNEFYINYNKQLDSVESAMMEQQFIITQLNDPEFEVSSLSKVLSDRVSTEIILVASKILLALKDQENQSQKEQNRLKFELKIQKGFLLNHLEQNISLLTLQKKFLREKITNLQNVALSLTYEQIAILENQIKHHITNAIENLENENNLYDKNLQSLKLDMASFPQKWASERLVQQKISNSHGMIAEVTRLVETKNINNNLEKIQAAPLDLPRPPILPKSPRLLLFTILGGIIGVLMSFSWFVAGAIIYGVKASEENLRLAGQHVSGKLAREYLTSQKTLLDSDLNTLRNLISFITQPTPSVPLKNVLLLLENQTVQYAYPLAELMHRRGLKILVLDLCFDTTKNNMQTGLLQYLQDETATINIIHAKEYDLISAGGICRYANEVLSSTKFKELVLEQAHHYDWIIAHSNVALKSAETNSLLNIFPNAAVSIADETLPELHTCIEKGRQPEHKYTFIIT